MDDLHVIVELRHSRQLETMAAHAEEGTEAKFTAKSVPALEGFTLDKDFAPITIFGRDQAGPALSTVDSDAYEILEDPKASTYLVRGTVKTEKDAERLARSGGVSGVFADVAIEEMIVCPGDPPVGTDSDVERLLCTGAMHRCGMDGRGVLVAIVDTGVNMAYLNSVGKNPQFDAARSWVPRAGLTPGSLPVGHGTMCAFDVCIAAPKCTLLDIALLQSTAGGPTIMSGFLSDAVRAYRHLINVIGGISRPGENRSLVVNNSWGMFHPSWDFPVGHSGNYSHNPNHPFNRIVGDLERAGADILFAAGNCGADCPDGRCTRNGSTVTRIIYGANSHAKVLSVAGVDTTNTRVGYSTQGPGGLTRNKPDIASYTHFRGSGVYAADGGTSAATPVAAGVVAAIRTKRPYVSGNPSRSPAAIRNLVISTANDLGTAGFDFDHGHGVIDGCEVQRRICRKVPSICDRYPYLCHRDWLRNFCRRYPQICRRLVLTEGIQPGLSLAGSLGGTLGAPDLDGSDLSDWITDASDEEVAVLSAYLRGLEQSLPEGVSSDVSAQGPKGTGGCGCSS